MVPFDNNFFMDFYGSTRHIFIIKHERTIKKRKKEKTKETTKYLYIRQGASHCL